MRFTKEQLTKKGLRRREITIPDTDGVVTIRELTTAEVREVAAFFIAAQGDEQKQLDCTVDLIIRAVLDGDGKPMFQPSDIEAVKSMSPATLAFIGRQISVLSGMGGTAEDQAADQKKDAAA